MTTKRIKVKVVPGASRNEVVGWLGDALKVRVSAPPEGGKANASVEKLLAEYFEISPQSVCIVSGHGSPAKVVQLPANLNLTERAAETAPPSHIRGIAFNQVPDSDNRIHSDELAQAYGFKGALVPGVTVSAYMVQPAIERWGLQWLTQGSANAVIKSPVYDGEQFVVEVDWHDNSYSCRLLSEDRHCADAEVSLEPVPDNAQRPVRRHDPIMDENYKGPDVTCKLMEGLQAHGCLAKRFLWSPEHEMARYFRVQDDMPALLRTDHQPGSGGYANLSFLLGCANRHFAAVARMSPWVHLQTTSQNYQAVPLYTELVSEMRVLSLFNKKGHAFADCEFNLFRTDDDSLVCRIEQRAIYLLRGAGERD